MVDPDRPVEAGPQHVLQHRAHVEQADERGADEGRDRRSRGSLHRLARCMRDSSAVPANARASRAGLPRSAFSHMFAPWARAREIRERARRASRSSFLLYNAGAEVPARRRASRASVTRPSRTRRTGSRRSSSTTPRATGRSRRCEARSPASASRSHYRLVAHARNLGLAGTLNEVLRAGADTLRAHLPPRLPLRERRLRRHDARADRDASRRRRDHGQPTLPPGSAGCRSPRSSTSSRT